MSLALRNPGDRFCRDEAQMTNKMTCVLIKNPESSRQLLILIRFSVFVKTSLVP